MRRLLLCAVLVGAVATAAHGQLIVGNDQSGTATIWNVDPTTGSATALYSSSGSDAKPWGMAYDNASNTLYWNNGSTLYSSPLGPVLTPTNLGTMMFNGASVNYVALGFQGGKLYGTRNITTEAVYAIDPGTLDSTQLYVYPSTFDFGGIDFDASNGLLYGLNDSSSGGSGRGLYEIDYVAQTTTFQAPYFNGETDIDGLAINNGIAYYVTDGPNTSQPFYAVDVATGSLINTIASPFSGSGTFAAAAWVPEPTSLALLALGGLMALRRR